MTNVAKSRIFPEAANAIGEAEPNWSLGLHHLGKRAIVDQGTANCSDASRLLQRRPLNQHATASCSSCARRTVIHPGEGVQHLKEKNESWNEGALGKAFAMKFGHEGYQHELVCPCPRNQPLNGAWRIVDVGVRQQQIIGRRCALDIRDPLMQGPELTGPASGQRAAM